MEALPISESLNLDQPETIDLVEMLPETESAGAQKGQRRHEDSLPIGIYRIGCRLAVADRAYTFRNVVLNYDGRSYTPRMYQTSAWP